MMCVYTSTYYTNSLHAGIHIDKVIDHSAYFRKCVLTHECLQSVIVIVCVLFVYSLSGCNWIPVRSEYYRYCKQIIAFNKVHITIILQSWRVMLSFSRCACINQHVFVFFTSMSQQWSLVDTIGMKPSKRDSHAACVITSSDITGSHPLLLYFGGMTINFTPLSDLWLLDITSGSWLQV